MYKPIRNGQRGEGRFAGRLEHVLPLNLAVSILVERTNTSPAAVREIRCTYTLAG